MPLAALAWLAAREAKATKYYINKQRLCIWLFAWRSFAAQYVYKLFRARARKQWRHREGNPENQS
jgi:hypothetical protein